MNIKIQNNCAYEKETRQDIKSMYISTKPLNLLRDSLQLESVVSLKKISEKCCYLLLPCRVNLEAQEITRLLMFVMPMIFPLYPSYVHFLT